MQQRKVIIESTSAIYFEFILTLIHVHFQVSQKPPTKENTKPVEFKLHTQQRALKRAMFNYSVSAHSSLAYFHHTENT